MTATHTRTHVTITFADPYLTCDTCKQWITGWHNDDACGCDDTFWNIPCGCERAGSTSACPSWNSVDGCVCQEVLGEVEHGKPAGPFPDGVTA